MLRRILRCPIVGVDVSYFAIERAKEANIDEGLTFLRWDLTVEGAGEALRAKVGSVDLVLTRDTLEHIPRDKHERTVANLAAVLVEGGSIMAQTPNLLHPLSRLVDRTHVGLRSPWGWRMLFARSFVDVRVEVKQFLPVLWRHPHIGYHEFPLPLVGFNVYIHGRRRGAKGAVGGPGQSA